MGKREKSFNRKIGQVEEIIKGLQKEYSALSQEQQWRFKLKTRINTQVQLQLCVSERKAKEYIRLVQNRLELFPNQNI